jgi:hypothetical protein
VLPGEHSECLGGHRVLQGRLAKENESRQEPRLLFPSPGRGSLGTFRAWRWSGLGREGGRTGQVSS